MARRRVKRLIVALFLGGCGGGGGGGESNSPPPTTLQPVAIAIQRTAPGCLISDNADAEVSYALGSHQAKTLLWSCANIGAQSRVRVEAFYTFDNAQQCFVEQSVIWNAGDCSKRATAPASPSLSASIRTISAPHMAAIGSGMYALDLDFDLTINGNLTAFKPSIQVSSSPSHFAALLANVGNTPLSGSTYILPLSPACSSDPTSFQACSGQKAIGNFPPTLSSSTTPGQQYTLTLTVLDFFGNSIGSTSFNMTAP